MKVKIDGQDTEHTREGWQMHKSTDVETSREVTT
jgi:hypothetical protein